jgi:hypothetical protein
MIENNKGLLIDALGIKSFMPDMKIKSNFMKIILIATAAITLLFVVLQTGMLMGTNRTEQYPYKVIKKFEGFEVREYKEALFARTIIDGNTYRERANGGFRTLASFIFGENEQKQKIAMTSPVTITMSKESTMEFMMPAQYNEQQLPKPKNSSIEIYRKPSVIMAAIEFGGWADDEKINSKIEELKKLLNTQNIRYEEPFQFMGYNPPYQVINRRNEVVVKVLYP